MNSGFLFSLLEHNRYPVAPSLSLSHLALSDILNFDRKVENKIEEQDEAKVVWLVTWVDWELGKSSQ